MWDVDTSRREETEEVLRGREGGGSVNGGMVSGCEIGQHVGEREGGARGERDGRLSL